MKPLKNFQLLHIDICESPSSQIYKSTKYIMEMFLINKDHANIKPFTILNIYCRCTCYYEWRISNYSWSSSWKVDENKSYPVFNSYGVYTGGYPGNVRGVWWRRHSVSLKYISRGESEKKPKCIYLKKHLDLFRFQPLISFVCFVCRCLLGLFYRWYSVILQIENRIIFPIHRKKFTIEVTISKKWIKNSIIFEIKGYFWMIEDVILDSDSLPNFPNF